MAELQPIYDPYKSLHENLYRDPAVDFLGFKLNSNFGIAACPATMNSAYCAAAFANGFDIVTYKTQRSVRWPANTFPNVLQIYFEGNLSLSRANEPLVGVLPESIDPNDFTIANSCGNNSEGPDFWQEDLRQAKRNMKPGQLLIASVVGTIKAGFGPEDYFDDFARTAGLAKDVGAPVIELNLSCPNVATEGVLCYDGDAVVSICKRVKERVGDTPMLIKTGYFAPTQEELLRDILQRCGDMVAGVSAINTIAAPVTDKEGKPAFPGPGREKAGISGSAIKWAGVDMVGRLKALRETLGLKFVITGTGGVLTPNDYRDYMVAGADAVQSATGAMWNPDLAHDIKKAIHRPNFVEPPRT